MHDIKPGDTIVSDRRDYLISDAKGFNLKDYEDEANYILIDTVTGSMEAYGSTIEELLDGYIITSVLQNPYSPARVNEPRRYKTDYSTYAWNADGSGISHPLIVIPMEED